MNKALFLDRDGVINVNHGYVYKNSEFDFIDGIFDLVKRANVLDYKVIIVTNQSGIGRGMYTESDFQALSAWMCSQFELHGASIDDVFFCPHHPEAKLAQYKQVCACRKPSPGMLLNAAEKHDIRLSESIMVGDKISDVEAANNAGLREIVWFNPRFIESNKLEDAQQQLSTLIKKGTLITMSHCLSSILSK
jgi:D-glycero-D-manno-heptose 1,7-bisphosphate phosphatase